MFAHAVCVQTAYLILLSHFVQIQTAMKDLEKITKDSSQGLDQTCPVLPGETTATGRPTGSLLLPNHFPKLHYDVENRLAPLIKL